MEGVNESDFNMNLLKSNLKLPELPTPWRNMRTKIQLEPS